MLQPTDAGKSFSATIKGTEVNGKVQYEDGIYYLCQDHKRGDDCTDKLGYLYSWSIHNGQPEYLKFDGVTDFQFGSKLYYSKSFVDFLTKSAEKSKISDHLLHRIGVTADVINYVTNRNDGISYMPADKRQETNSEGDWKMEGRQQGKPAKTVRKLFTAEGLAAFTDKDFEIFANIYKSISSYTGTFSVVQGDDIIKWYKGSNYAPDQATLSASCMRDTPEDWFYFYSKNPKHINMLILVNDQNKLVGRALLWTINDERYLDRIYGTDATVEKFKQWADDNNCYHKRQQNYENKLEWVKNGEIITKVLEFELEYTSFPRYPYVDTFSFIRRSLNKITNKYQGDDWGSMANIGGGIQGGERYYGLVHFKDGVNPQTHVNHYDTGESILATEATYLVDFGWVRNDEIVVEAYGNKRVPVSATFICQWSGERHSNHRKATTVDGDVVFNRHPSLRAIHNGDYFTHVDNVFTCVHTNAKWHKAYMLEVLDANDQPVLINRMFEKLYCAQVNKIKNDRQVAAEHTVCTVEF